MRFRRAAALAVAILATSGGGDVQAQDPPGSSAGDGVANPPMAASATKQRLKQARHYLKRGRIPQAISELKAALKLPRDRHAGALALTLYKAHRKAGRFDEAMATLQEYRDLPACAERLDKLSGDYGPMRFTAARKQDEGVTGAVAVQAKGLISRKKKAVFREVQARLSAGVSLPAQAWLPFGEYQVGGRTVEHRRDTPIPEVAVVLPRIVVIAEHARDLEGPVVEAMARSVGGELRKELAGELSHKKRAKALLAWRPELVVSLGAGSTQLARMLLPTTPTLFAGVPKDLWKRMLRRGRKGITGIADEAPWPVVARLFRQVVPGATRVGIVARTRSKQQAEYAASALGRSGIEARVELVRHAERARTALARVARGADALWALPDTGMWNQANRTAFLELCDKRGAACLGPDEGLVEKGVLMAIRPPQEAVGARLAELARAIVRDGRKPEDLPIAPPTHYAYVLNVQTAERLGLSLSEATLREAARLHGRSDAAAATTR